MHLCIRTKTAIKAKKELAESILSLDPALLTDSEKRERNIKVKTALKTIAQQTSIYKEYSKELIKICGFDDVLQQQENLNELLDEANLVASLFESSQEKENMLEKNTSTNSMKNITLEKYTPSGLDKFIKYKSFMEEYREFILAKPFHPLIKLRHLHNSLEGEALKLIKSYTLGDQLTVAIETLENAYSKPDLVIAEIYRNIKGLASISSFNGKSINVAKEQVSNLKIAITTLKSMGFGEMRGH